MVISKSVVIHLGGRADLFEEGCELTLSPDGQMVAEDVEVILDGKRCVLEAGDKVIITETLYGYPVIPGNGPLENLLKYIQDNYLEWDVNNPKFQAAAKMAGIDPLQLKDPESLRQMLSTSPQSPELKSHLLSITTTQLAGPRMPSPDGTAPSPGDIDPNTNKQDPSPQDGSNVDSDADTESPSSAIDTYK